MKKKVLLWLDDYRDPNKDDWLNFSPIGKNVHIYWAKSFDDFTDYINEEGLPDAICFDHDLGDISNNEKTGYDCAKYLVNYCIFYNIDLPKWNVHSSNPVGKENINKLLTNYVKYCKNI